jgi:hypothetical protein
MNAPTPMVKKESDVDTVSPTDSDNYADSSKKKKKEVADQFPMIWESGRDIMNVYLIVDVETATWITSEMYKEINNGTISASLYVEKSEYSVVIGGSLIKRASGEDAAAKMTQLIAKIKNKLKDVYS